MKSTLKYVHSVSAYSKIYYIKVIDLEHKETLGIQEYNISGIDKLVKLIKAYFNHIIDDVDVKESVISNDDVFIIFENKVIADMIYRHLMDSIMNIY